MLPLQTAVGARRSRNREGFAQDTPAWEEATLAEDPDRGRVSTAPRAPRPLNAGALIGLAQLQDGARGVSSEA